MSTSNPIIFQHLAKTAGTTLQWILRRQYAPEAIFEIADIDFSDFHRFQSLSDDERSRIALVMGHTAFRAGEVLTGPYTCITVLRDPVDRVVSHYYYVRRTVDHPDHALAASLDLGDYVRAGLTRHLGAENMQTWQLSWPDIPNTPPKTGFCPPEYFDKAMQNLRERFRVVGITEEFDSTVLLMKRTFDWTKQPFYPRLQVGRERAAREEIPADVRDLIREYNQMDQQLYDYALTRLHAEVRAQGDTFSHELREFQSALADFNAAVAAGLADLDQVRRERDQARAGMKQAQSERDSIRRNLEDIQSSRLWRWAQMGGRLVSTGKSKKEPIPCPLPKREGS